MWKAVALAACFVIVGVYIVRFCWTGESTALERRKRQPRSSPAVPFPRKINAISLTNSLSNTALCQPVLAVAILTSRQFYAA
jgi:hypothetical protein